MKWLIQGHEKNVPAEETARKLGLDFEVLNMEQIHNRDLSGWGLLFSSIYTTKVLGNSVYHLTHYDKLTCNYYYAYLNDYIFNYEYEFLPLQGVIERWYSHYDLQDSWFLRPNTNDKIFTGFIPRNRDEVIGLINGIEIFPHTLVVIAPAVYIPREWRCFMHNGKVIDCFQYKEKDILAVKHDKENTRVTSYAESVPMYEGLPPVYVLDIAEDSNRELKVLEVGAINVSGLYGCDPEPIIKAIVEETEKLAYVNV